MRSFPRGATKGISIFHLPSTAGSAQAYPSTPDVTTTAALLPLDRKNQALEGIDVVEGWELYLDPDTDVRVNDKIVIAGDSTNWYVHKIFTATFGRLRHRRVTITKQL